MAFKNHLLLLAFSFFSIGLSAQKTTKTITIEEDGTNTTVEIITKQNGLTTVEKLEGKEAQAYLNATESNQADDKLVEVQIRKSDLKDLERELEHISIEVEQSLLEHNIDLDSIMNEVEKQVERSTKCIKKSCSKAI